jgi:hypothetical protein
MHETQGVTAVEFHKVLEETEKTFHFGVWLHNVGEATTVWSWGMYKLLGIHPSIPPSHDLYVTAIHPEDRSSETMTPRLSNNNYVEQRQLRLRKPGGAYHLVKVYDRYLTGQFQHSTQQVGIVFEAAEGAYADPIAHHVLGQFGPLHESALQHGRVGNPATTDFDQTKPLDPPLIRAARGILDWSAHDLAEASKLSFSTVRRAEHPEKRGTTRATVLIIRRTFENHGVRFLEQEGATGIMLSHPIRSPKVDT